ncbi:Imm44 family immunity protein [Clostridium estertheticum]|uniref:Imm44 family immunity protein n=1 Tax=Clostridium estertheticum TaxID=238834 RepID=UPI00217D0C65|nr:Imm44 family immunity protein [Clostridium estertheticum]
MKGMIIIMKINITAEIDSEVRNDFQIIRKEILEKIKLLEDNEYGLNKISIIPIIVDITPELESAGFFRERKLIKKKEKIADIRLRIDFIKFKDGDKQVKRIMIIENIMEAVHVIGEKMKKEFNAKTLEADLLNILEVNREELNLTY